ncbi:MULTISPECIES: DNA-3-methyladenine glycosylase family protein [Streptomyces]|uniref:DNA-3-methyladenine glycosylase II n=2 Tax=Streptomyces rimosus subsp. rimosus TaxID=132474 RepID=L8ETT6_STRR1|nr:MULTISPECIES: DNA-3-methyladenine glycosylase [Streptomyces]KOG73211.1 Fe-S cluster assembly protein HesB [Kitasatospora aureofaciens]MYT43721.1 DNA-3-methyladenine glycosylase 2 family protein [Streptomyces sp. SID5471]KUJ35503.1 Fe-S cluster assembly protein HesB [Streptomyces rimosus subsp. rimosus]QDA09024.1 DNA-3-methyladenine glycosylase 2 family protein [Streptomyces rimosus]QEV80301.1 DNA-3-methyladenine glycosylase 2 family protein [Streptomyces rimosus]
MSAVAIAPQGPFSLAASVRFLESFTPARYRKAPDDVLRLAFPSDDGHTTVAAAVRQEAAAPDGTAGSVRAEFTVYPGGAGSGPAGLASAGPGRGLAVQEQLFLPDPSVVRERPVSGDQPLVGKPPAAEDQRAAPEQPDAPAQLIVRDQLARILSLDVDGSGFQGLAVGDPVVSRLMAEYPGLRPVCFHSPYEAAVWAVIGQRMRRTQAAAIKARLAERYGQRVRVAGRDLHAFPTPPVLRSLTRIPGLPDEKVARLHALAEAAEAGELDAARLRAMPGDYALATLRALPGVGPFSAELILIRGAGHPDVFPRHERRLHASMANAYGLGAGGSEDVGRLAAIADRWRPYRSWVALLLRVRAEQRTRPPADT